MAISDKLLLLNNTKQQIRRAIESMGYTVGDIPFSQYPDVIDSMVVNMSWGLFQHGQALNYDFANHRYGTRLPDDTINFTINVNDLGIVTRASAATYWGPEGSLLEAAVDEPRFDHDPVTGEPLGVLIEPSLTNWISNNTSFSSNSADFSSVDDTDPVMGSVVRVTAVAAGENASGHDSSFGQYPIPTGSLDASPGILRVIYAKPVTADYVSLRVAAGPNGITVKLSTAEIVQSRGGYTAYVKALAGGWVQIAFYQTTSATSQGGSTRYIILIGSNPKDVLNGQGIEYAVGDEVLLAYPSMYQAVPEGPPQSIIPTSGSRATRAADNAVIDLSNVFNPDEGTYVVRAVVKDEGEEEFYAGWYSAWVTDQRLSIKRIASGGFCLRAGSGSATISPPDHLRAGDVVTLAITYNEGQITAAAFGEASTFSSNYSPNGTVNLVRGAGINSSDNTRSLESSGTIAGFEYYPEALSESRLAEITAFNLEAQS